MGNNFNVDFDKTFHESELKELFVKFDKTNSGKKKCLS